MNVGGPCNYSGCRRTAQFNSDFCYKHRNEKSPKTINSNDIPSDDSFDIDNQIIKYEIDGKKKTIDSKEIDNLLSYLKGAKKFWIVDLTVDDNEFVQYAIEKGELEHWDRLEMIESKEMSTDQAFSTLRTKITGDYSGHQLWWNNEYTDLPLRNVNHTEEDLDEQEEGNLKWIFIGIVVILFVSFFIMSSEGDSPGVILGNLVGEAMCQAVCGLGALFGGAGASQLGRSDSGKFTK